MSCAIIQYADAVPAKNPHATRYILRPGRQEPFSTTILTEALFFRIITTAKAFVTPGIYAVSYNVYVPEGIALNTSFFLQADGVNVPSSVVYVNHTADDPSITYSGQALIEVGCSPVSLRLSSSEIINYSTFDSSALASIIIYKIGE
mgnify:CR=1 FL=1